jgi:hypothetical protein
MFNSKQWYLNDYQNTANYVYAPTGIASEPPTFEWDVIGLCTTGTYYGQVTLANCPEFDFLLGVEGSVKIDKFVYDSVNKKGKNGYILSVDLNGIRWIPPVTDTIPGTASSLPGIGSSIAEGIFVLNEGTPLY